MSWREEFEKKTTTPEEAVRLIKSGDRVAYANGLEPNDLSLALLGRAGELKDIRLFVPGPGRNYP